MIKVAFCCLGNICRSTMSQSVLTYKVRELGLEKEFLIDSFATSTDEIPHPPLPGNPPHPGTVNQLKTVGIPLVPHRAKQIGFADYLYFDYIIGMDEANMRDLRAMLQNDPQGKLYRFLEFAGQKRNIADPYFTGNFAETYADVQLGCDGFLNYLKEQRKIK